VARRGPAWGGLEAAARTARRAALTAARDDRPVLLAHTLDDQAETVLLGLARGSGARSIAGMRAWHAPWGRPLLGVRRTDTLGACTELGLTPHHDPHNRDPGFTRVRLRTEVLPLLEDVLGGGAAAALARTAAALRADNDLLDDLAADVYARARAGSGDTGGLRVGVLAAAPAALRTRAVRRWLREVGATAPTSRLIAAVDALIAGGRGQVAIGGTAAHRLVVAVDGGTLTTRSEPR
ncbi:MAG: ATP-binding protein, partial [Gordonia sp. (in: high G+C Gram-positive bacteria)]